MLDSSKIYLMEWVHVPQSLGSDRIDGDKNDIHQYRLLAFFSFLGGFDTPLGVVTGLGLDRLSGMVPTGVSGKIPTGVSGKIPTGVTGCEVGVATGAATG